MRRTLAAASLLSSLLLATTAAAAPKPVTLSLQGRIAANGGGPVADGDYAMAVKLYPSADAKEATFEELFIAVPVKGGVFSIVLGGNPKNALDPATFGGKIGFVGVQIGSDPELPREALRHVPFAVQALTANGLDCSGCVTGAQIADGAVGEAKLADGAVTGAKLAAGAVTSDKVAFAYAGSAQKGGAASDLDCVGCVGNKHLGKGAIQEEQMGIFWAYGDKPGGMAVLAKGLSCTGCVKAEHIAQGTLHKVAGSGKFADLDGKDALFAADNSWTGKNAFDDLAVQKALNFNQVEAKLFRFQNADKAPAACDDKSAGLAWFHTKDQTLVICNGKDWVNVSLATVGTQNKPAQSCKALQQAGGATADGIYWLDPDGAGGEPAWQGYCEMTTDGGGWTLLYAHAYQKGDKGALSTSGAQLQGDFVAKGAPDPTGNYRVPLKLWNALGGSQDWLYKADAKTSGPAEAPKNLWVKATGMYLDPADSYRARHSAGTKTTASHACLQKDVLIVHSLGPLSDGCAERGHWETPNCVQGPPWPRICCWCITIGSNIGEITPSSCGTSLVSGHLFYADNNPQQRCSNDKGGLSGSKYGAVTLWAR